jgi:hypothetical protein
MRADRDGGVKSETVEDRDRWEAPGGESPGAIHRDSGCVSAGLHDNSPSQTTREGLPDCGPHSVTSVTILQPNAEQRSGFAMLCSCALVVLDA